MLPIKSGAILDFTTRIYGTIYAVPVYDVHYCQSFVLPFLTKAIKVDGKRKFHPV